MPIMQTDNDSTPQYKEAWPRKTEGSYSIGGQSNKRGMYYPCGRGLYNKLIQALKKLVVTETVHLDSTLVQVLQHLPAMFATVYHSKLYAHHSNLQYTVRCSQGVLVWEAVCKCLH